MFSPLRNRFGIPGVISVIALVFAMIGGAYAASNGGSGGDATASAKKNSKAAKRGPRGPRGKTGPAGPAGPQGPAGANGAKGDTGAAGANGKDGAKGATGATGAKGATGAAGAKGATGEAGPLLETLPKGKTLKGHWSLAVNSEGKAATAISFQFPLSSEPTGRVIKEGKEGEEFATDCPGSAAAPEAKEGVLCIYTSAALGDPGSVGGFAGSAAGTPLFTTNGEPGAVVLGSWAVTGE